MSFLVRTISWSDQRSAKDIIETALSEKIDYWVATDRLDPANAQSIIPSDTEAELVTFRERFGIRRWSRFNLCLPASLHFLAVRPSSHAAVAISVKLLASNAHRLSGSRSLNELVTRLSEFATNSFVDDEQLATKSTFLFPSLTIPESTQGYPWLRERIQSLSPQDAGTKNASSATDLTALKAGFFLLNEQFDDSHSCSQSIEGKGSNHTGDYWHAILHRREPDYGNAKYWFRHVGRHLVYAQLAQIVSQRLHEADDSTATKLERWKSRLIPNDKWEPFVFVDLCEAAEKDAELRAWCEQVQYDEMVLLLESSAQDVFRRQ